MLLGFAFIYSRSLFLDGGVALGGSGYWSSAGSDKVLRNCLLACLARWSFELGSSSILVVLGAVVH